MAARARLIPPQTVRTDWPWHQVKATSLHASILGKGDRRFEGGAYLASGYGIRLAFSERVGGWESLREIARTWMPNRLKGVIVDKEYGYPYLSATQMLDLRPTPRRFLALSDAEAANLSVEPGTILVTRSGTVGRTALAHRLHEKTVLSDDLLRVVPKESKYWGWIYAYLQSHSARQMMRSLHYGHMIKHLETSHLDALPVPIIDDETARDFHESMTTMLAVRNRSFDLLLSAEALFEDAIGFNHKVAEREQAGFVVNSSDIAGRRRLEATFYSSEASSILQHFQNVGLRVEPLRKATDRVWWGARFRRVFGDGGVPYYSADDLWTLNPKSSKSILLEHENSADIDKYKVKAGWLIMACSGQTYGLNGSVDLVTGKLATSFLSHDLIRIMPKSTVRPGYLLVAMGHRTLGRPLFIRNAYGSSIPHLDPEDVADSPLVRLPPDVESSIADAAEESVRGRHEADELENALAEKAEAVIHAFLKG